MSQTEIRWKQRLGHFKQALSKLDQAVELAAQRPLSELETHGLIQGFEYTHELAWNTMRDFLLSRGVQNIYGSKDATRESFQQGLILDGESWMDMIRDRNLSSHTYNEEIAGKISTSVLQIYFPLFHAFLDKMKIIEKENL